ncbi:MAG: hypothetical protein LAP85_04950 [Acidobacteriia bacterium]|nr:hypothetical protein [Terriglobia bacterium]
MTSHANETFWVANRALTPQIRTLARKQYRLWRRNPFHPSLYFKKVADDMWSLRIGRRHRALAACSLPAVGLGSDCVLDLTVTLAASAEIA